MTESKKDQTPVDENAQTDPPEDTSPAPAPSKALADVDGLSKDGLDKASVEGPTRRYEFKNGYGAKVWAGDAPGEFRVAALTPTGRVTRHLDGVPRLPASLPVDKVNEILETVAGI